MTYRYCQPGCFQSTCQVVAARNINTTPGIGWRKSVGKHRKNDCSTRVSKKTFQENRGLVVDQVHVQSKASIGFRTLRAPCLKFVVSGVRSSRGHPLHSVISGKRGHLVGLRSSLAIAFKELSPESHSPGLFKRHQCLELLRLQYHI